MPIENQLRRIVGRFTAAGSGKKGPQDILAVDFDERGAVCVRMRKTGEDISVLAADILSSGSLSAEGGAQPFALPKHMIARHVAICVSGDDAVVKLLSLPGALDEDAEAQLKSLMGVDEENYRISYKVIGRTGGGRSSETKLLTLALPESLIKTALGMFPVGQPAPITVEVAGLASISAFLRRPIDGFADISVGIIEFGVRSTFLAFFHKAQLVLIRKFDFGVSHLLDSVEQSLGVDTETAREIIDDGSFDISQLIKDASEPFVKQLVISKHFVERREDCNISRVFVPMGVSRDWLNEVRSAMAVETSHWNPFDGFDMPPNVPGEEYSRHLSRFSAAVGAAIGVFEETS